MMDLIHKIVFAGPVGVGKTTAINMISDTTVVDTESKASDEVAEFKSTTTVAMDYGTINLNAGEQVHLYGTPGQERFSFMWDILGQGSLGVVLLMDNSREDPLADLTLYCDAFRGFVNDKAIVIGVTRTEQSIKPGLYSYHTALKNMGLNLPVFEVDPRSVKDVRMLMITLISLVDPGARR